MNPLAVDIWIYIACGYILVSLTIWIVARFSPLEWVPAKQQPTVGYGTPYTFDGENNETNDLKSCYGIHEDIEMKQKYHVVNEHIVGDEKLDIQSEEKETKPKQTKQTYKSSEIWWPDNRLHLPTSFFNMEPNNIHENEHSTELLSIRNDFTLKNCFWFAIGALMQQGSDLYPRVIICRHTFELL